MDINKLIVYINPSNTIYVLARPGRASTCKNLLSGIFIAVINFTWVGKAVKANYYIIVAKMFELNNFSSVYHRGFSFIEVRCAGLSGSNDRTGYSRKYSFMMHSSNCLTDSFSI